MSEVVYWNREIECLPVEQIRQVQSERLVQTVKLMYDKVPYYRAKMDAIDLKPEDIRGVDDLDKLPFCTKADLRDAYPFGAFAADRADIVRVHASSGTTGKSTVCGYTRKDIDTWSECIARAFTQVGLTKEDIVHVAYGYGLFTGGLGAHYGSEFLGSITVPASAGNTKRQIQLLKDFGTTAICCTPSFALYLADTLEAEGYTKADLKLKAGFFGAEAWTEEMRAEIEDKLGLTAYDIYGLSEIMGPGVANDCLYKEGMHIPYDHFLCEIIDPETGKVLPEGEYGELVITTITKEGMPLIRYRTRDITALNYQPCRCGRTSPRMAKVTGRSDDMLIIRGVNVFPSQIESVVVRYNEVAPHYMIYVDRVNNLDTMEVHVEMSNDLFSDTVRNIEAVEKKLSDDIKSTLNVGAKVVLVNPRSIPRSQGKAQRVIDNRKKS